MSHQKDKLETSVSSDKTAKQTAEERWREHAAVRKSRLADAIARGGNRHLLEQTRILRDVIHHNVLANEPGAADARWAEHGYMNAFEATEAFTMLYVRAYASWRERLISNEPHDCPVDSDFAQNDPGTMNALYSARQFADAMGIPYSYFIQQMMGRLMRDGGYRRVPLPNHLFPPIKPRKRKGRKTYTTKSGQPIAPKALRHALKVREGMNERFFILDDRWDPRFHARNYVGDPAQERAFKALVEYKEQYGPRRRVARCLREGVISEQNARRYFSNNIVDGALQDAGKLPSTGEPDPGLQPFRPHCLGLIQPDKPAAACASCDWVDKCKGLAIRAEAEQFALTGYSNRKAREKAEANARQRKSREERKAGREQNTEVPGRDQPDAS